ncbi:PBS lyase HEAT domain protein repeat-containing protein [Caldalkalibacillus thermarum TA2.A1]|uniref:PBS lyase HEAT domain protein repeat-containing protein n=1 Tax=Caldalkalibacillus thermarum (strain TA2.A1) TaxID=986075 RepID=F5L5D1_CALTT|nr:hypothetical protein [Caldalkalibacillus thermarum]EGL83466.1 PBS lyase HEAT domain protein repeat-containing protein [Caldalkalibacillus thermarum TA2.A1]QZT34931.1 hypothetical protein HUR95_06710 [Caldalkalibacillus thermarum TA2.A1]
MLVAITVTLFVLQILLWMSIAIKRMWEKWLATREAEWKKRLQALLDFVQQSETALPRYKIRKRHEALFMARELSKTVREMTPQMRRKVGYVADHLLSPWLGQELERGRWASKLNALYYMEDLGLKSLADQAWRVAQSAHGQDDQLAEQALRALAKIKDHRALAILLRDEHFPPYFYLDLLRRYSPLHLSDLKRVWNSHAKMRRGLVLTLLEHQQPWEQELLRQAMDSEELDIRLAALKVLATRPELCPPHGQLDRFLHSPHWQEQARAAYLIGQLGWDHYLPDLVTLLQHKMWWVRYRAGEALVKLMDAAEQSYWSSRVTDRYGRDMLQHWITVYR